MPSALQQALLFTLIPFGAAVAGGFLAAFWPPRERTIGLVQHFAAGVVLAAATGELLPHVVESRQHVPAAVIGFGVGLALVVGIKLLGARLEESGGSAAAGLVVTAGVDTLVDGFVIGLGFVLGGGTGALLAIALAVELLFLGLSASSSIGGSNTARWKVVATSSSLGLLIVVGAAAGVILLGGAPEAVITAVLAFGSVALLYLVMEELLVEAHEIRETAWDTAVLFGGFVLLFVVEMLR